MFTFQRTSPNNNTNITMKNLNFRSRIFYGFMLVLILMLSAVSYIWWNMSKVTDSFVKLSNHPLIVSNAIRDIRVEIYKSARLIRDIRNTGTDAELDNIIRNLSQSDHLIIDNLEIIKERFLGSKQYVIDLKEKHAEWASHKSRAFWYKKSGAQDSLVIFLTGIHHKYVDDLVSLTYPISDFAAKKAGQLLQEALSQKEYVQTRLLVIIIILTLLVVAVSYVISKGISRPITRFVNDISDIFLLRRYERPKFSNERELFSYTLSELNLAYQNIELQNEEIKSSNEELMVFNRQLDEKVIDKTSEIVNKSNELEAQKYFFEQVFIQSSVSTQILDKEGWCVRINPKLSSLFGVDPKNIEGRVYNIFNDAEVRNKGVISYLERVFKGEICEWEVFFDIGSASESDSQKIEVSEKKKAWFHNWAYPVRNREGLITHVIIQHTDITERKNTEILLKSQNDLILSSNEEYQQLNAELNQAKVKAEESDLLKTIFLENISHEIRTPLNAIIGFTRLYLRPDLSLEKKEHYTRVIENATSQLLFVVDNIITLAMINSGQIKFSPSVFNSGSFLQAAYELAINKKNTFGKTELRIVLNEQKHKFSVLCDYSRLLQVMDVLIDNAVKFTDIGSVEVGSFVNDSGNGFYVKDTGIGIEKDKLDTIFKKFVQSSKEIQQNYGGLGIGLSIAQGILLKMNCGLIVESEVNNGTYIGFYMPAEAIAK